jgi:hypothetical protein
MAQRSEIAGSGHPFTRNIDGRTYQLLKSHQYKQNAEDQAEKHRELGKNVRIVKKTSSRWPWAVYVKASTGR